MKKMFFSCFAVLFFIVPCAWGMKPKPKEVDKKTLDFKSEQEVLLDYFFYIVARIESIRKQLDKTEDPRKRRELVARLSKSKKYRSLILKILGYQDIIYDIEEDIKTAEEALLEADSDEKIKLEVEIKDLQELKQKFLRKLNKYFEELWKVEKPGDF